MIHFNPSDFLSDDLEADPRCDLTPEDFDAVSAGPSDDDDYEGIQYLRDLHRSLYGIKDI